MKIPGNPFILTGYYGSAYFCDRREELKLLKEHINNERNVVLYSWRRMGKTALIQHFIQSLQKRGKAEVIYTDLLGTTSLSQAIQHIAQSVYERYKVRSLSNNAIQKLLSMIGAKLSFDPVTGMPELSLEMISPERQQQSLKAIGDFLSKRDRQIIVAIDEFQQISQYEENNAEAVFRGWTQQFPSIRFIFSGSHRSMMLSMFAEKNRPFYQSTQLMPLDPISVKEYTDFIQKHFSAAGKVIERPHIKEIHNWSRQQTYSIQLICNKLYSRYKKVNKKALSQVYAEILTQEAPVFANYQQLLSKNQWQLMLAMAKEEPLKNPMSNKFLQKHSLGAASTVSSALKSLINKEIVIQEDGHYLLHDVLLARWLKSL